MPRHSFPLKKKPSVKVLKKFIDDGHAAFTAIMLAQNICDWEWKTLEFICSGTKDVAIHAHEIRLFYWPTSLAGKQSRADFEPGDVHPSRLAISVQKIVELKHPRLLLIPVSLFRGAKKGPKTKGAYKEDNWEVAHRLGLLVNPITKTFFLFEPAGPLSAIISRHAVKRLEKLFKPIGYSYRSLCSLGANLQRGEDDLCVPWSLYFFASVIAHPKRNEKELTKGMSYKGLIEFLYYLFHKMRNQDDACGVYLLGDDYPEVRIDTFETLEDATYGLEPEEFDGIDILGIRQIKG